MSKGMIYKMDFLTKEPSLFIFSKKKYYTKIGVIISFIVFICSLGFECISYMISLSVMKSKLLI